MNAEQQPAEKSNKKIIIIIVLIALVPITIIALLFVGGTAVVAVPTYFSYVEKGYASEAKITLKDIHQKCTIYMFEVGEYPSDLQAVIDDGYLDSIEHLEEKWEFELAVESDGEEGTITATSLEGMAGGSGFTVVFDVKTKEFSGTLEGDSDY